MKTPPRLLPHCGAMQWLKFERLGLAYRVSSSGNLKGISLVFQSTFDR